MSSTKGRFYFTAEHAPSSLLTPEIERHGLLISDQQLPDLLALRARDANSPVSQELFTQSQDGTVARRLQTIGAIGFPMLRMSPDGHYLLVRTLVTGGPPASWNEYSGRFLRKQLWLEDATRHVRNKEPYFVFQYELIDPDSDTSQRLIDAPAGSVEIPTDAAWSADSKSVVVAGTYLPLDVASVQERRRRTAQRYVVEVNVPDGNLHVIANGAFKLRPWNGNRERLTLETSAEYSTVDVGGELVSFENKAGEWKRVKEADGRRDVGSAIRVFISEDANTPPRVVAERVADGQTTELLNLNPTFDRLQIGRVEAIRFTASGGRVVHAGLYWPRTKPPGKKYPLVIQTHGWNPRRFWASGPYPSGFAAQPLASCGIVVAQLEEDLSKLGTQAEVEEESADYEGVVKYLNGRGIVDTNRVGVIGFSRTSLGVKYALTHSAIHFAAATIADGTDMGYFQYVMFLNSLRAGSFDIEQFNGGVPFYGASTSWSRRSLDDNFQRVVTPVRLEAYSPVTLSLPWEWFVGLSRLHKPVELVYIPDGAHVLVKPWNRLASQQGNVDWFRFWLQDHEDPDPAKAEQYKRWRELRKLEVARDAERVKKTREPATAY